MILASTATKTPTGSSTENMKRSGERSLRLNLNAMNTESTSTGRNKCLKRLLVTALNRTLMVLMPLH